MEALTVAAPLLPSLQQTTNDTLSQCELEFKMRISLTGMRQKVLWPSETTELWTGQLLGSRPRKPEALLNAELKGISTQTVFLR